MARAAYLEGRHHVDELLLELRERRDEHARLRGLPELPVGVLALLDQQARGDRADAGEGAHDDEHAHGPDRIEEEAAEEREDDGDAHEVDVLERGQLDVELGMIGHLRQGQPVDGHVVPDDGVQPEEEAAHGARVGQHARHHRRRGEEAVGNAAGRASDE